MLLTGNRQYSSTTVLPNGLKTWIGRLDYQVMQSLVVFGNLLTDLTYALIDPRIRIK